MLNRNPEMFRAIVLLILYLHSTSGHIVSKPASHYSDVLKVKCEALPYRSVLFERNCYFAIDAETDATATGNKCSLVLAGSQVAANVNDDIFRTLFLDKTDFVNGGDSTGKKKAMCLYENVFPHSTAIPSVAIKDHSNANQTDQKMTAKMNIPYLWEFPQKLEPGQTIVIKGVFNQDLDVAAINLQTKNQESVILHMKPLFKEGRIVLNTAPVYNKCGREENIPNPLKKDQTFDIRIRINEDNFNKFITIDGMPLYDYKYRLPLTSITHFWMWGSGSLTSVKLGEMYNPVPYSIGSSSSVEEKSSDKEESGDQNATAHWNMPYLSPFTEKIEPGKTVIIKGGTYADVDVIAINLQTKSQESIALHFKVMFNKGIVVLNTASNYWNWGKEEKKANPLVKGGKFDVRIRFQDTFFQITVNDVAFYNYNYRVPLSSFTHLWVWGSGYLTLAQIGEKYTPIESSFAAGFPVCGQDSCSAQREMYATRVQVTECKSLYVSGILVPPKYLGVVFVNDFSIDLKRKNGDIALRIFPRFDKNNVGLNTFKGGKWLTEQTVTNFPFKRDKKFQISITNEAYGFQIFVDGAYFATFEHRTCPFDIIQVEVSPYVFDLGIQL